MESFDNRFTSQVDFKLNETDMQKSSTFRELRAVEFSLKSFSTQLHGKFMKLYTDNQNVVRIISVGSTVHDLQKLAISIFQICITANVALEVAWIPRVLNFTADHFSKVFDFDAWSVNKYIFTFFESRWGRTLMIDLLTNKIRKLKNLICNFGVPVRLV